MEVQEVPMDVELSNVCLSCCKVCNMILKDFSMCSADEQAKILEGGRPTLKMDTMGLNENGTEEYGWLTYCEGRMKLFCWPCLLFSKENGPLAITGISEVPDLLKEHMKSKSHIDSMVKWKTIGKVHPTLDDDDEPLDKSNNWLADDVMMNKKRVLKRLIRVFRFLSVHELCSPLAVGEEPTDPIDQNKYEQFLIFIGKYDDFLKKQLVLEKQFLGPAVRRQIISSISEVMITDIMDEISQVNFVSIIVDEVAEIGKTKLISTVVRYVGAKGEPTERFLNFKQISANKRADSLFRAIFQNVALLECPSKVVSFSCSGGLVTVNEMSKLQSRIKDICKNVCFLHYCEHKLISVLAQSLSTIKLCKRFFSTLKSLAMFFLKSKKLGDELNSTIRKKDGPGKDYRWDFDEHLIANVSRTRVHIINLFQSIVENKNDFDFETVMASSKFLPILTCDIPFNFLLLFLEDIFLGAGPVSDFLVANNESIDDCIKNVQVYTNVIKNQYGAFCRLYSNTSRRVSPFNKRVKHKTFKSTCERLYESVILNLMEQLKFRFHDFDSISFLSDIDMRRSVPPVVTAIPCDFGHFFDAEVFQMELNVLWQTSEFNSCEPRHTLKKMRQTNFDTMLPWAVKLYEMFLALPLTKTDSSSLARINRYLQTSSLSHRLSPLAFLNIEKELSEKKEFDEEVIKVFFLEKETPIPLFISEE